MTIKLRIVGIYYNNNVELGGSATVKQVVDAAVANPGANKSFGYVPGPRGMQGNGSMSITAFYANYENSIISESSGLRKKSGEYYLSENLTAGTVWQFYMFDKEGRVLSLKQQPADNPTTPTGGDFDYFDSADAIVPDGGAVVWRLVKLLFEPNAPSSIERSRLIMTPANLSASAT